MHQRSLLAIGAIAAIGALLLVSCETPPPSTQPPSSASSTSASGSGGGGAAPPLEPLPPPTHPKVMRRPPPDLDCGPGCKVVLGPIQHASAIPFADSSDYIADNNLQEVMIRKVGDDMITVIPEACVFSFINNNKLACAIGTNFPNADMVVIDLQNWAMQSYFHTDNAVGMGFNGNYLSDKYTYWAHEGVTTRADLVTGERVDIPGQLRCDRGCFANGYLYCGGRPRRFDPETLDSQLIAPTEAAQFDTNCSPDRKYLAWIDYRDPPGLETSPYDGRRKGGEVYMHEIATGKIQRMTFDSPDRPVVKSIPAVSDDYVVWMEPCATCAKEFDYESEYMANPKRFGRLNRKTGQRCYYEIKHTDGYLSLRDHTILVYWTDTKDQYIIELDLEDPSVPWECAG